MNGSTARAERHHWPCHGRSYSEDGTEFMRNDRPGGNLNSKRVEQTSYQDLKRAFLATDDSMAALAAWQVFQRVEEVVEEMVEEILLTGKPETTHALQDLPMNHAYPTEDVAKILLQLRR